MVVEIIKVNPFSFNKNFDQVSACIGYFDGIHLGHRELIEKCIQISKDKSIKSAFITFDPDPWTVFHNDRPLQHLTTLKDKFKIVESYGIDIFYVIEFSREFASFSVDQFHSLLKEMHIHTLVCGFDFRYAYKNTGDIQTLLSCHDFNVEVIDSVNSENTKISTTRIEPLVENGNVLKANTLLNYIYSLSGTVEHGFRRGSELLNIPTANLKVDGEYLLPKTGVYAGYVFVNDTFYKAMINVGKNPTFDNQALTIEAHILDFNEDIYDLPVRFFFYSLIREETKFASFMELKNQLHQDIETTRVELEKDDVLIENTKNIWNK